MRRLASFFVLITALIVGGPLALARSGNVILGLGCGIAGALAWIILFVIGLSRYGKVFYWFLLGAPLGLFWPLLMLRWLFGSMRGDPNWMAP